MIKRGRHPKIFFGWWMVLASGILNFWAGGFGTFGFSALFKPIALELGFSRAATSVAASIRSVEGGFLSPVVGWLTDRFGPRWMVLSGVLIIGLSLILMNFINSLWAFILIWGILQGTGFTLGLHIPLDKAITNWFVKKRGRALATKFVLGTALAVVLMVPIVAWLVSAQGWRMTCVTAGLVIWIIGLPLGWFFMKQRRPEYYGLLPDGATTKETAGIPQMIDRGVKYAAEVHEIEFTLRQAMMTRTYWLIMVAMAGFHLASPIFLVHCMPFLTDMGIEPVKAAVIIGLMGIGVFPGAFISMFVADRMKKEHLRFLLTGAYFLNVIGITAFLLNQTLAMVYPLFIFHHFAGGVTGSLSSVILGRYFGRKAFASIRGTLMMFMLPFSVVAPIYAGWVYDTNGSYIRVFLTCGLFLFLSAIIISLAFPPKPPAHITDIQKIV
ncbi:MFS transporter [Chloroflexota bacterium]